MATEGPASAPTADRNQSPSRVLACAMAAETTRFFYRAENSGSAAGSVRPWLCLPASLAPYSSRHASDSDASPARSMPRRACHRIGVCHHREHASTALGDRDARCMQPPTAAIHPDSFARARSGPSIPEALCPSRLVTLCRRAGQDQTIDHARLVMVNVGPHPARDHGLGFLTRVIVDAPPCRSSLTLALQRASMAASGAPRPEILGGFGFPSGRVFRSPSLAATHGLTAGAALLVLITLGTKPEPYPSQFLPK